MMPFADLTKHKKILGNIINTTAEGSIYTEKEFHAFLNRERWRITRNDYVFSIVYFQLKKRADTKSTNSFIRHLKKIVRATDELGWFDGKAIGVYLYNTPKEGASSFIRKVITDKDMQNKLDKCEVYTYPCEWFNSDNNNNVDGDNDTSANFPQGYSHKPDNCQEAQQENNVLSQEIFEQSHVLPFWKRSLDIFVVSVGLILLSPLLLLVALYIKLVSPGPVFFKQERVGLNGKTFTFWKFRTMQVRADTSNHQKQMADLIKGQDTNKPMTKRDDNPNIIPLGRIIRKTCIDEFPQFINVLRGEMSLVGPRPPICYEVEGYHHWHKERFNVLPGLTGLWQVSGKNRLTFNEMIRLDIKYGRYLSLFSDLKILFLTPFAILVQVKDSIFNRFPLEPIPELRVQLDS